MQSSTFVGHFTLCLDWLLEVGLMLLIFRAFTFKVRVKPEGSVWMEDTVLKNLILCMPEVCKTLLSFLTDHLA